MNINMDPVRDMLAELHLVNDEINSLLALINNDQLPLDLIDSVAASLMVKGEEKQTILWLLEEEFIHGLSIDEVLQNIQRAK